MAYKFRRVIKWNFKKKIILTRNSYFEVDKDLVREKEACQFIPQILRENRKMNDSCGKG